MQMVATRVRSYRLFADALRATGQGMKTPTGQTTYAVLAEKYDHVADWLENGNVAASDHDAPAS
jgi:hypothetical protein